MNDASHSKADPAILLSVIVVPSIACVFMATVPEVRHWFVLPVTLCGILVCPDAIRWLSGKYRVFDLYGLFGVFGVLFFFLNPLMQMYFGHTLEYARYTLPSDFRPWLGLMGVINFFGLLMFFAARTYFDRKSLALREVWVIDPARFRIVLPIAIAIAFAALLGFWSYTGGIFGAASFETFIETDNYRGTGPLRTFSDSFAILLFLYLFMERFTSRKHMSLHILFGIIVVIIPIHFLVTGLRGSRADFLVGFAPIVIAIHYRRLRITRLMILLGVIGILVYGSVMGVYKIYRTDMLHMVQSWDDFKALRDETSRTWYDVLLRDFGRSDVQALLCQRALSNNDYSYSYGETYIAAICMPIPVSLRPDIKTRVVKGTEMLHGYYDKKRKIISPLVYGISGEAILNFGIWAAPFPFLVMAYFFSLYRRFWNALPWYDVRLIMLAFILRYVVFAVMMDSDILTAGIVKNAFFPCLALWLASVRVSKSVAELPG